MAANYALLALQEREATIEEETVQYYRLTDGSFTHDVRANLGVVLGESGPWQLVMFSLEQIKPDGMSKLKAAQKISACEGFLAFDYRMLAEYARADISINGRTFTYTQVLDAVQKYEWWKEEQLLNDDETPMVDEEGDPVCGLVRYTGSRSDYVSNGFPSKLVRIIPMPKFLGVSD